MPQLFVNNAATVLNGARTAVQTSLVVSAGTGSQFPAPTGGDYFLATLCDALETVWEIVRVTGRSGDTLTVLRAQEGTTALAWVSGSQVQARMTAGPFARYEAAHGWGNHGSAGYAAASHNHAIANVTGLQTALDGKQAAGSYAAASHTHPQSAITGLVADLEAKDVTTYLYNPVAATLVRQSRYTLLQNWNRVNASFNLTSASWQVGDIITLGNVRHSNGTFTVVATRIDLPNGLFDDTVFITTAGRITLAKYSSTTGWWMLVP